LWALCRRDSFIRKNMPVQPFIISTSCPRPRLRKMLATRGRFPDRLSDQIECSPGAARYGDVDGWSLSRNHALCFHVNLNTRLFGLDHGAFVVYHADSRPYSVTPLGHGKLNPVGRRNSHKQNRITAVLRGSLGSLGVKLLMTHASYRP